MQTRNQRLFTSTTHAHSEIGKRASSTPHHIGVVVATSIAKHRRQTYGNITAVAVVQAHSQPPYGSVPGKPGFGTLGAAVEDSVELFPQPPILAVSQTLRETILPGQSFAAEVTVSNVSSDAAKDIMVGQRFNGLDPTSAIANLRNLYPGTTRTASAQILVVG